MFSNWKYDLTHNWDFMRLLRLGLGIMIVIQAWYTADMVVAALGGILMLQSFLNVGCCGPAGCGVPRRSAMQSSPSEDAGFEEIKAPAAKEK